MVELKSRNKHMRVNDQGRDGEDTDIAQRRDQVREYKNEGITPKLRACKTK